MIGVCIEDIEGNSRPARRDSMDDGGAAYWGMEMTLGYARNISSAGNCEVGIKHPAAAVVKKALGFLDTVFAQSPQAAEMTLEMTWNILKVCLQHFAAHSIQWLINYHRP